MVKETNVPVWVEEEDQKLKVEERRLKHNKANTHYRANLSPEKKGGIARKRQSI